MFGYLIVREFLLYLCYLYVYGIIVYQVLSNILLCFIGFYNCRGILNFKKNILIVDFWDVLFYSIGFYFMYCIYVMMLMCWYIVEIVDNLFNGEIKYY